ncbi:CBS domain-containing protein [Myxococcus stipitatus]|uniref:CBS domain-containing protein n=1 Tax=Myxococcus stipitatus TaxID=83455 RepID=UPI0031452706
MAQRSMDSGRDEERGALRPGLGPETVRPADAAPPGSRERGESDVSGWNPARDELSSVREGRFHRAAMLRMAQVRTDVDDRDAARSDAEWATGGVGRGPYGRDDRDDRYATGIGPRRSMGDQDQELAPQAAEYRPWDRMGYGGERPVRGEGVAARELRPAPSRAPSSERSWHREPLTAREVMTREVRTARRDSSLREVARLMREEDRGVIPVVDERGRLVGLVTDRDLALRAFVGGQPPEQLRVADVMTEDIDAVTLDEPLLAALALMTRRQLRRIPVIEHDDRLVGVLSLSDIAERADSDEELQRALARISSRRSFWTRLR